MNGIERMVESEEIDAFSAAQSEYLPGFHFTTQQRFCDQRSQHLVHHPFQIPRAVFLTEATPHNGRRSGVKLLRLIGRYLPAGVQLPDSTRESTPLVLRKAVRCRYC